MQKHVSQDQPWKSVQQQRDILENTNSRQLEASPRSPSIFNAMESDIRQPRLHQHRLSVGQLPQDETTGANTRGSTQHSSHSRSSSGNIYSTSAGGSPISYGASHGGPGRTGGGGGGSDSNSSSGGQGGSEQRAAEGERGRLNQLMTNFFLKLALVVVRSRMDLPPVFARGTATKKVNKWFNVELEETDVFREDLRPWKYADAIDPRPPSLVIETYLDAEELTGNQTLVILDENERRHNVETTLLTFRNWRSGNTSNSKKEVILERWRVDLGPQTGDVTPELAVVYKKSIVLFRSLYSYARLLPSWKLYKKLAKGNKNGLRLCCRIVNGETHQPPRPDPLGIALIPKEQNVTKSFQFGAVESPAGVFTVTVDYRKNCDFRVDDSEALLSSVFLNLDEQYFKPSLHQRTGSQPVNVISRDPGSLPSHTAAALQRADASLAYGSLTSFHQVQGLTSQSPITALRNLPMSGGSSLGSPSDVAAIPVRPGQGSKASLRSESGIQRRTSLSLVSPFRQPPLSASPAGDVHGPSPRTSLQRIPQVVAAAPARQRQSIGAMSPSSIKSTLPVETPTSNPVLERPASVGRYSSSFPNRRQRVSSGASRTEDDNNSSGRGSLASAPGSGFVEHSGVGSGLSEDDKSLTDFMSMLEQKPPLKIFDNFSDSSGRRTVAALGKYQKMKESNTALHESMSTSLFLQATPTSNPTTSGRTQPGGPSTLSGTSVSTSSSPGKPLSPHTPAVPSRLVQNETIAHEHPSGSNEPSSLDQIARMSPGSYDYRRRREAIEVGGSTVPPTTSTTATTSPMNIPSSPRLFQTRHSNPVSHDSAEEESSSRFQSLRRVLGPEVHHPASVDSIDRPPTFFLSDEVLPSGNAGRSGDASSQRPMPPATSLSDESLLSSRGDTRVQSNDRMPASSFGNRRPFRSSGTPRPPTSGRTSTDSRPAFVQDDELLFDFSDRRSLDRSRGNSSGDNRGLGRGI